MKYLNNIITLLIFIALSFSSCKKDNKNTDLLDDTPLNFISLSVPDTVFRISTYISITATATGKDLEYIWSYDDGIILGNGNEVQYSACCEGVYKVTCKIKDYKNRTETKSILIYAKY